VVKITETEVLVRELVQDGSGDWSERDSSLRLQGVK
jgi:Tfp pilus assembly protein PilP